MAEDKGFSVLDNRFGYDKKSDTDIMYPMYFGVSCAFFALQALTKPHVEVEKWSEIRDSILQGSAQVFKLRNAEREIENLKKMRHEDAKANEKVVGIFATQEQSWLQERRKLREHIGALMNELRVFEKKKDEVVSEMSQKLKEIEDLLESRDKVIQEGEQKRKELEENLVKAEREAEELRESVKLEAQEHSSDLRKHKTAFIELVSNQRQLEAELGRAMKQLEAAKQELGSVLEKKEESELLAQKLSIEIGEFNSGKSTVINALLGERYLKEGVVPTTNEKEMTIVDTPGNNVILQRQQRLTEKFVPRDLAAVNGIVNSVNDFAMDMKTKSLSWRRQTSSLHAPVPYTTVALLIIGIALGSIGCLVCVQRGEEKKRGDNIFTYFDMSFGSSRVLIIGWKRLGMEFVFRRECLISYQFAVGVKAVTSFSSNSIFLTS
ncbi:hypothetical protein S83_051997 [Arachis hypogaea]